MIDAEVIRLRRLRDKALKARAIAGAMHADGSKDSLLARGAVSCWAIARVATGQLRSHPYRRYQRGPSVLRSLYDRVGAHLLGQAAERQGTALKAYAAQLRRVARELDDVRALTWLPDLSDTLGRSQTHLRSLIRELDAATRPARVRHGEHGVEANWPYLAF